MAFSLWDVRLFQTHPPLKERHPGASTIRLMVTFRP